MTIKSCIGKIKEIFEGRREGSGYESVKNQEKYRKFTYHIRCTRCNMEFSYKYSQIVHRQDYSRGFVHCPFCDAENAHTGIRFTVEEGEK